KTADIAYTLQVGRKHFPYRKRLVCSRAAEAAEALADGSRQVAAQRSNDNSPVIFVFPGLGAQYVNMARELYLKETVFRREMNACFNILQTISGNNDIQQLLYPDDENSCCTNCGPAQAGATLSEAQQAINGTDIAQLVVFSVEYSLARQLIAWGIRPRAMIGYSFGEYTAACISGVFSLEDALKLVSRRGALLKNAEPGRMLSVPLPKKDVVPSLPPELSLAIDNGPSCIVAGPINDILRFQKEMKSRKIICMQLQAAHALHSGMMASTAEEFEDEVKQVTRSAPMIPYISNVSADWITADQCTDPTYWSSHLKQTVRFAEGVEKVLKEENAVFIEVGPGRDLTTLLSRYYENRPNRMIDLIRPQAKKASDVKYLLGKIGVLWLYGVQIDWNYFHSNETRRRIPLPTYPFEGERFPLDSRVFTPTGGHGGGTLTKGKDKDKSRWFYQPVWKQVPLAPAPVGTTDRGAFSLLVFNDGDGLGSGLAQRLQGAERVITVTRGETFRRETEDSFSIVPKNPGDYEALVRELPADGKPLKIVHLWGTQLSGAVDMEGVEADLDDGFFSLIYLARALGAQSTGDLADVMPGALPRVPGAELTAVTRCMQAVAGEARLFPGKAPILSALQVIDREYPHISCRCIDLDVIMDTGGRQEAGMLDLAADILTRAGDNPAFAMTVLRGNRCWVREYDPLQLPPPPTEHPRLRQGGVYLLTGGMGGIGLALARMLAEKWKAKIVLTARSSFPDRQDWPLYVQREDSDEIIKNKIRKLMEIEILGGSVLVCRADVSVKEEMEAALTETEARFGTLNGVIHAAGKVGGDSFKTVADLDKDACRAQFRAKINGVLVLAELLQNRRLDFCLLMSSISALLGGYGLAAYAAANIFMDNFVHYHNRGSSNPWYSVDWDGWLTAETGGATEKLGAAWTQFAMSPEDGVDAFERILAGVPQDQVVNSTGALMPRLTQARLPITADTDSDTDSGAGNDELRKRPNLTNAYVPPSNPVQEDICRIWQNYFGYEEVGIKDDFFELGGDSLKAIAVSSLIYKKLNVKIPIPEFFNRMTTEGLAEYIAETGKTAYQPIKPAQAKDHYHISASQKRMYFLHILDKDPTNYNIFSIYQVEGRLDKERLGSAFTELVKRHESLRTGVTNISGVPFQEIRAEVPFEIDYREMDNGETVDVPATDALVNEFIRPFDLSTPPLLRVGMFKTAPERFLLIFDMHHIISDGTSLTIIEKDIRNLYDGITLPAPTVTYKDYSEWQREYFASPEYRAQDAYWLEHFSGELPVLNMPLDFTRPPVLEFEVARLQMTTAAGIKDALERRNREHGTTLYIFLLAAYYALLFKYTAQDDIVVGTIVEGREHDDLREVMGIFINSLLLRNFPAAHKPFSQFLQDVRDNTLEAYANQQYPIEDLLNKLQVRKDLSRTPLFDTMFIMQNEELSDLTLEGVRLIPYEYPVKLAKVDFLFQVVAREDVLVFNLEYCPKLFTEETMERFLGHFHNILECVSRVPETHLGAIDMMGPEEREHILTRFQGEEIDFPAHKTVLQLFEEHAEKRPDAVALTYGESRSTYRCLEEAARVQAGVLRRRGIGKEMLVGILLERTPQMPVSILAAWKAGAAYIPIDPAAPAARVGDMLADSQAGVLYTLPQYIDDRWKDTFKGHILEPPTDQHTPPLDAGEDAGEEIFHAVSSIDVHSMAYVIYTSGSTGKPKGAVVEHIGMMNHMQAKKNDLRMSHHDIVVQNASHIFDISVWQFFVALIVGGQTVIYENRLLLEPGQFWKRVQADNITILEVVPSHLGVLLDTVEAAPFSLPCLQHLLVTGEEVKPNLVERWFALFPEIKMVNAYGPTEASDDITHYIMDGTPDLRCGVPIGHTLQNLKIYIVDGFMNLVPAGVMGEICVAGVGVGRGYLNDCEKTSKVFMDDPFSESLQRLYKTGDLGRWLPDGNIDFAGRIDFQVKIRGYRIELGEIENKLLNCPGIKEAVVVDRQNDKGTKYLCAYTVSESGTDTSDIKTLLAGKLPDYMLPAYFVSLDAVPLTPNGKVDRKNLPEPTGAGTDTADVFVAPEGGIQQKILAIWKEELNLEQIGATDNFFQVGGNSLIAMKINSRLKKEFDREIPVVAMFSNPTIRELARYLEQEGVEEQFSEKETARIKSRKKEDSKLGQRLRRAKKR
ncbi:MAG: amino acid adenylation domain-containing protein, partial [bacterium]|nr:amino acid adenylation domain-containing protein [bacterium]